MLFGTSNNPMCHIFLILSYVYIFLSESYHSHILFSSCISSITVSLAMPSTTSNTSSQTPSVNGWYSTPPRTPSAYWRSTPAPVALFVKVSPGRACNDYNLIFCVDVKWQTSQQPSWFPKLLLWHWQITPLSLWKHPVVIVETFKVKVYLAVSRHFSAQPFHPALVLAFAWQLISSLHLRLAPFLGSSIVLQFQYWSSKFWKSTVLDSAKAFGQICFFCYIALSILSPRVRLKERVDA